MANLMFTQHSTYIEGYVSLCKYELAKSPGCAQTGGHDFPVCVNLTYFVQSRCNNHVGNAVQEICGAGTSAFNWRGGPTHRADRSRQQVTAASSCLATCTVAVTLKWHRAGTTVNNLLTRVTFLK
jgi:hypothetical protein